MQNDLKIGIIKTLTYFDIFDYPLTLSEIRKYNELKINANDSALIDQILSIPIIQESNGFFYFLGRSEIVKKRQEKNELSPQKFGKALVLSKLLSKIPSVEYIGVSGNLAINNSPLNDDIELFIITSKNTLWLTKLWVSLLLRISKQNTNSREKKVGNKLFPHIYIDKSILSIPKISRNLYFAHKIVKLRTLFSRSETENEFLCVNKWIKDFLPNIELPVSKKKRARKKKSDYFLMRINKILFDISRRGFNKATNGLSSPSLAVFESIDVKSIVLDLYELRLKKYLTLFEGDRWIESEEARFYLDEKKVRILN